jgi:CBS domain-containing protein
MSPSLLSAKRKLLPPQARLWTVRADATIAECVTLLREHSVGALVVLTDDKNEEICGIFTERDIVRHLELIQRGGFWDTPVRTVMTAGVVKLDISEIERAPRLMAEHHIRHLPVVTKEKGRERLVGVLSMRDIFRQVMEEHGYDLHRALAVQANIPEQGHARKKKIMGVFSSDPAMHELVDKGAKLTRNILMKAAPLQTDFDNLRELFDRFDTLFVDLDDLDPVAVARLLVVAKAVGREDVLFLAFNPTKLTDSVRAELHRIGDRKRVYLFSKPINLGLLYEKFLRDL